MPAFHVPTNPGWHFDLVIRHECHLQRAMRLIGCGKLARSSHYDRNVCRRPADPR